MLCIKLHEFTAGTPPNFTCQCWCPDVTQSDWCTITWDRLHTVSCSSLQFSVSLTLPNGTSVYNEIFDPSITQTTLLDLGAVYTATITAENVCGDTTCSTECSPGKHKTGYLSLWYTLLSYSMVKCGQITLHEQLYHHMFMYWTPCYSLEQPEWVPY